MPIEKVNLTEKFALFSEPWKPKIVGEVNDCQVKLVKILGEFVWHQHEREDELFLTVKGRLTIRFRDRDVVLNPGESITLPTYCYHKFWGADGKVLVGEVSAVNDDDTDNRFLDPLPRYSQIEEDEPPVYLLCTDYPDYYHIS